MARARLIVMAALASLRAPVAVREISLETDEAQAHDAAAAHLGSLADVADGTRRLPTKPALAPTPAGRAVPAGAASDLEISGNETMHRLKLGIFPESAECGKHTGGTCTWTGLCDSSRGPAECVKTLKLRVCNCPSGWCGWEGVCYPVDGHCTRKTGGTCKKLGCNFGRGHTTCVDGECLCKRGFCAHNGACWPVTATGGTCKLFNCKHGECDQETKMCMCPEGQVWYKSKRRAGCRIFPFHDESEDDY